jgi:acyl-CoA dehydrogenase
VALFGTEEQRQRMIPPVLTGEDLICFAVTEPNTGLDTTKLKTRAERRDGGYLVNGEKIWISVARQASKMMLLARTTPLDQVKRKTEGLSLFFTDLDRAKVEVREIQKMGRHSVDSNLRRCISNQPPPTKPRHEREPSHPRPINRRTH